MIALPSFSKSWQASLVLCSVALSGSQGEAATPRDPFTDPLIRQVQARHERAVAGDKEETKNLTHDLELWTRQYPDNHLLLAYLGSAYTLCSRDSWIGPGKLTYLRKGSETLDAAVAAEPENSAVRFIRALDYFELPSFIGKHQIARDDFIFLLKQIKGEAQADVALDEATTQAIYYYAGLSFRQGTQSELAQQAWASGVKLDPSSVLGKKMVAELAE